RCTADARIRAMYTPLLRCVLELSCEVLEGGCGSDFRPYFQATRPSLQRMQADDLIELTHTALSIRPAGRLLAHAICMQFDQYLPRQAPCNGSRIVYA